MDRSTKVRRMLVLCSFSTLSAMILLVLYSPTIVFTTLDFQHDRLRGGHSIARLRTQLTTVVASQRQDNTSWLQTQFPTWDHRIYLTDDPGASLRVPESKGREAMVYLTYIIDNYDTLPPVTIFQHANRYQWHNDDPLYDGARVLKRLNSSHVYHEGYVNLRCAWTIGCPAEIHPHIEEEQRLADLQAGDMVVWDTAWLYEMAFQSLFPGMPLPEEIGTPCCAQFAVADWKIRERPKSDYEWFRYWLMESQLNDHVLGRIFEYSWHIIFGQDAVSCPDARQCYCSLYGLCELECEGAGVCQSQYTLPKYSTLPDGWPDYGWDGEWQNAAEM